MANFIDLSQIPKKGSRYDWTNAVGVEALFEYEGIKGVLNITGYKDGDVMFKIGEKEFKMFSGHLKDCKLGIPLGLRKRTNNGANLKSEERFIEQLEEKFGNEYKLLSEYKNNRSGIKIKHTHCGYEFPTTPNAILRGRGCPICKHKIPTSENSLEAKHPRVASLFHKTKNGDLKPSQFFPTSTKEVWWQCEEGHEWFLSVANQVGRAEGRECATCSGREVLKGFNDLETTNPEALKFWDYEKNGALLPSQVTAKSGKRVWWKCENNHSSYAPIDEKVNGSKCCYCTNQKLWEGWNDFETTHPLLSKMWSYSKNSKENNPTTFMKSSKDKYYWECEFGHTFLRSPLNMVRTKGSCPHCNNKIPNKDNCLATVNPDLAKQWHPTKNGDLTPKDFLPFSSKKVWWLGKCGHEWRVDIASRSSGNNCPYCAGQQVLEGFNDLATTNPDVAKQWHPTKNGDWTPKQVTSKSGLKAWFICEAQGHEHYTVISDKTNGVKCPYCSGYYVSDEKCLATVNPQLAKEWHPTKNGNLTPKDVNANTHEKMWWLGKCGHEWKAIVKNRNNGFGCPICNQSRGECYIQECLKRHNINFKPQHRYSDCRNIKTLPFDVAALDEAGNVSCLIEFDGEGHFYPIEHYGGEESFKERQINDNIKNQYCEDNNIILIRIPYWLRDYVDEVLTYWLKYYHIIE